MSDTDPPDVPAADDVEWPCEHENLFNHCRACMAAAGLNPRDIAARVAAVDAHHHGAPPAAPPPVRLVSASAKHADKLAAIQRKFRTG